MGRCRVQAAVHSRGGAGAGRGESDTAADVVGAVPDRLSSPCHVRPVALVDLRASSFPIRTLPAIARHRLLLRKEFSSPLSSVLSTACSATSDQHGPPAHHRRQPVRLTIATSRPKNTRPSGVLALHPSLFNPSPPFSSRDHAQLYR